MKILQYLMITSFLFCIPAFVCANSLGIAVDQTNVAFDIDFGETQKFVIKIMNISDATQEITIGAQDYLLNDNNQLILIEESDEQNGIKDWMDIESNSITLAPGESQNVVFVVTASKNASIGSHRGAVIFRVMPNTNEAVKVQGQIGVHILVNVKGDTHASGRVNSFDVPLLAFDMIDYNAEFENTGNIHYVPYGEVVVRNVFTGHEQMYKYDKHFVFPEKKFMFSISDGIPSIFGLYKARVTFVDGEGATRSKSDYVMGYLFPLIFVVSVGTIIFIVQKLRKKRGKNTKKATIKKQKSHKGTVTMHSSKEVAQKDIQSAKVLPIEKDKDDKTHKINIKT